MKRLVLSLSAIALVITVPVLASSPVRASIREAGTKIAQLLNRPEVKLDLDAAKRMITVDGSGNEQIDWQELAGEATVVPGDVLRYTVSGENTGDATANDFVITQPIPTQTIFVLDSADSSNVATITYSIDNGATFSTEPTIQVDNNGTIIEQPAPAESYTHIRWSFEQAIVAQEQVQASYQVSIK
ncbi:MAG: hypothetical protein WBG70_04760 [Spirulinaceae cyanobacterium]